MANQEHLEVLRKGIDAWNEWWSGLPSMTIDMKGGFFFRANLSGADLTEFDLRKADLRAGNLIGTVLTRTCLIDANLSEAHLHFADLTEADLSLADLSKANLSGVILKGANLKGANLKGAHLSGADLSDADLRGANLSRVDFSRTELRGADLSDANLSRAYFISSNIDKAKVSGSTVYAVNVWDLRGEFEEQQDLIITRPGQPRITVDNIKVAQFVYLLLDNEEIRDVINTLTSKTVLILGRFADDERKAILDALRNKLREYNLLPIVFDFDRPVDRNITETVKTLAAISYFVIADVTSPKSSPLELQAIVPDYQIPVVPIIQEKELPFSMMADLQSQHDGVLAPLTYHSEETLIKALKAAVIDPAIEKHRELRLLKAQRSKLRKAEDFIEDKGLDSLKPA